VICAIKSENVPRIAQKKIDGKYYDICQECWTPLEAKLKGKEASSARSVLLGLENSFELGPLKELYGQLNRPTKVCVATISVTAVITIFS
jgi:hypothetical protein